MSVQTILTSDVKIMGSDLDGPGVGRCKIVLFPRARSSEYRVGYLAKYRRQLATNIAVRS